MGGHGHRGRAFFVVLVALAATATACTGSSSDDGDGSPMQGANVPVGSGGGDEALATLEVIDQMIDVRTGSSGEFEPGETGQALEVGDQVRSNVTGFGELSFFDGSWMRIEDRATLTIDALEETEDAEAVATSIDGGRAWARAEELTESGDRFEVGTPVGTASVRGTRFSIDCTLAWPAVVERWLEQQERAEALDFDPDTVCGFTVIEGSVVIALDDGEEIELAAAQSVFIPEGEADPVGPIQRIPDELYDDPWIAKNLGIDVERLGDDGAGPDSDTAAEAAALARRWQAQVEIVSSTDPRFPVGDSDTGYWDISLVCADDRCTSSRVVTDADGAPAVFDADGSAVVDQIEAAGGGAYDILARWNEPCERDGAVLAPRGIAVAKVGRYQVSDVEFRDGRWIAVELTGRVTTTSSLTQAGRDAGCALPGDADSVAFTSTVTSRAR